MGKIRTMTVTTTGAPSTIGPVIKKDISAVVLIC
jgi:hypothetical protein